MLALSANMPVLHVKMLCGWLCSCVVLRWLALMPRCCVIAHCVATGGTTRPPSAVILVAAGTGAHPASSPPAAAAVATNASHLGGTAAGAVADDPGHIDGNNDDDVDEDDDDDDDVDYNSFDINSCVMSDSDIQYLRQQQQHPAASGAPPQHLFDPRFMAAMHRRRELHV